MQPPDLQQTHTGSPSSNRKNRSAMRHHPSITHTSAQARKPANMQKRIMMNPPAEFVALAAAEAGSQPERVNAPIVIGEGGQAVMVPPLNQGGGSGENDPAPPAADGMDDSPATAIAPTAPTATVGQATQATETMQGTQPAQATQATQAAQATQPTQTQATQNVATTVMETIAPGPSSTTAADSAVTSVESQTKADNPASTTSPTETVSSTTASATSSSALASSTSSASTSPSPSTSLSAASASTGPTPFTRSALFIFLIVLASLVLIAVLATSLSWIFRRPWFPCWSRHPGLDDDDDGLSDLVTSFHSHTPSRSSTIRRSAYEVDPAGEDIESGLQRRSRTFASDPTQSPFLHSGSAGVGVGGGLGMEGLWGIPLMGGGGGGGAAPSIQVPAPAHLYGGGGPLEIRNAVPGEMEAGPGVDEHTVWPREVGQQSGHDQRSGEMLAGGSPAPRFLGLDGHGLDVPWSRQTSSSELVGLGIDNSNFNSTLTSPYVSAPDARDYLGHPPFPSPLATEDDHQGRSIQSQSQSHAIENDIDSPPPQRAGTWASNLRNTLFAAISGTAPTRPADEDRFTRPVLPLHRDGSRRASAQAFPVIEEKDDHAGENPDGGEHIGSVFLAPSYSSASEASLAPARLNGSGGMGRVRSKRVPLGGAGERYRRYYAKSASSGMSSAGSSESSWSVDERVPSRLAGGERAKGVRG